MQPIYTSCNTAAAYQLNWTIALFGKTKLPMAAIKLSDLAAETERDGVRLLSANVRSENVLQFLASTRPAASPSDCVRSIKGRLQYMMRADCPKAFRRNYHIQSVGQVTSAALDHYVALQSSKHVMVDPSVQARVEANQFHDAYVDLSLPATGTYGQYLNSLHIVLENAYAWHEVREVELRGIREMILASASKNGWQVSRIGLLTNHVHILLGARVTASPEEVALELMNSISLVYSMKPVLKFSYYVGTFGRHARGALRAHAQQIAGPAGASPDGSP